MAMMDMTGYLKDLVYYQISSKDADKIIIINYDSLEEKTAVVAKNLMDDERYRDVFIDIWFLILYNMIQVLKM